MSRGEKIKEIEEFPRRLKIFFFVIVFLLILGTIGFRIISEKTINDSFFRTLQTLAFIFNDKSSIYERIIEIFLAIVGVFLVWWVLWSVADMILDGNLRKYLKTRYYSFLLSQMRNHIIIVGGGRVGEEIARVLTLKKKQFLIIEIDSKVVNNLKKKGYVVIKGDSLDEETLKNSNIKEASRIIITLPKTESNILLTLTSKELNPSIEVHARCENPTLVTKLKRAGAKVVTVPEIVAADKIANDLGI